jgi:hypothetical protein
VPSDTSSNRRGASNNTPLARRNRPSISQTAPQRIGEFTELAGTHTSSNRCVAVAIEQDIAEMDAAFGG